jgi:YD repeat-containing protein
MKSIQVSSHDDRTPLVFLRFAFLLAAAPVAQAQILNSLNPPEIRSSDRAGVDLTSGMPIAIQPTVSIGPPGAGLSHSLTFHTLAIRGQWDSSSYDLRVHEEIVDSSRPRPCPPGISGICKEYTVRTGAGGERFLDTPGGFVSLSGNGATLVREGPGRFVYTARDGTRYKTDSSATLYCSDLQKCGTVTEIAFPDGRRQTLSYASLDYVYNGLLYRTTRLRSVAQNNGYQLVFQYMDGAPSASNPTGWGPLERVIAVNNTVDYCNPLGVSCTFSTAWPTATFAGSDFLNWSSGSVLEVTTPGELVTRYTNEMLGPINNNQTRLKSIRRPTSSGAETVVYDYDSEYRCNLHTIPGTCVYLRSALVVKASVGGAEWNYQYFWNNGVSYILDKFHPANNQWSASSTGPDGCGAGVSQISSIGQLLSVSQCSGSLQYTGGLAQYYWTLPFGGSDPVPPPLRVNSSHDQAGRSFFYKYDARGNVVERRQRLGATDNNVDDIVASAGFDAICTHPVKCNKPNWTRDANGNVTDYTYDLTHGGILTETAPAPNPAQPNLRPQKRYTYVQRYAWYKGPGGSFTRAATPIWLLSRMSFCRTGAPDGSGGCALGTADEVSTSYEYGPDSGPNNLLLRGQAVTALDAAGSLQTYRTCYAYDALGNKISETTPNAALASCP